MYLLIWIVDGKILYQRFKNLDDMINKANEKEEVIAHTKILSPIDMINSRFIGDENAETLEDKLRDEHRPIPEEREDRNLFEIMAEKFKPKQEEEWTKDDGKGPIRYKTFKEIIDDETDSLLHDQDPRERL